MFHGAIFGPKRLVVKGSAPVTSRTSATVRTSQLTESTPPENNFQEDMQLKLKELSGKVIDMLCIDSSEGVIPKEIVDETQTLQLRQNEFILNQQFFFTKHREN